MLIQNLCRISMNRSSLFLLWFEDMDPADETLEVEVVADDTNGETDGDFLSLEYSSLDDEPLVGSFFSKSLAIRLFSLAATP